MWSRNTAIDYRGEALRDTPSNGCRGGDLSISRFLFTVIYGLTSRNIDRLTLSQLMSLLVRFFLSIFDEVATDCMVIKIAKYLFLI